MKKISLYLIAAIGLFTFYSCEEEGPIIILEESQVALLDTTYISDTIINPFPTNILFEEFSGVACSNCPAGNTATHTFFVNNPGRIVPVTVHSAFLAQPYDGSPDLRSDDADLIANTLGPVGIKPSCFVNRKIIDGNRLQFTIGAWEGYVNDELGTTSNVGISLEIIEENETERTFTYRVTVEYAAAESNQNLGFFLTESHIIAEQLNGIVHIPDYEHEFVLRKSITPIIGEPITTDLIANTVIIKEFEIDLDDYDSNQEWKMEDMHLIAFIREANDDIANATMVDLIE